MRRLGIFLLVTSVLMLASVAWDNETIQAAVVTTPSHTPNVAAPAWSAVSQRPASPANPTMTRLEYANFCAAEMGVIPAFKCSDGAYLATTVGGVGQTGITGDCDKPDQLNSDCVPGARLLRPTTSVAGVQVAIICRKYTNDTPSDVNEYSDIAVIEHNPATGHTCFFQSPVGSPIDTTSGMPSPMENSGLASSRWLEPGSVSSINCQRCHAAGPFIWTPWIGQVVDVNNTGWDPKGKYGSNFHGIFASPQPAAFNPSGNLCTSCHRIGSTAKVFFDRAVAWGVAASGDPRHPPVSAWMPPGTLNEPDWHAVYDQSVAQLNRCFKDPTLAECNTAVPASDPESQPSSPYTTAIVSTQPALMTVETVNTSMQAAQWSMMSGANSLAYLPAVLK